MKKVNEHNPEDKIDLEPESVVALINNWNYDAREPIILQLIELYDTKKFEDAFAWDVFWNDMKNISAIDIVAGGNIPYVNGKLLPQSNLEQIMREYLSKQVGRYADRIRQMQRAERDSLQNRS